MATSDQSSGAILREEVQVDALFLANGAEVREGLLYVLGGGWTRCWPPSGQAYPLERPLPICVLFRVPYHESNREIDFIISVRDGDEREFVRAEGAFKVGRDVDLTTGMSQLVPMVTVAPARIESPGIYHITVQVSGVEKRRIAFEALHAPPRK